VALPDDTGNGVSTFRRQILVIYISRASQQAYLEVPQRYRKRPSRHQVLIPNSISSHEAMKQRIGSIAPPSFAWWEATRVGCCCASPVGSRIRRGSTS
jgi:hypothetical protein